MGVKEAFGGALKQVEDTCNQNNDYDMDESHSGYAYKDMRGTLYCLEECDISRGRGEPKRCRKHDCDHYTVAKPVQKKITDYLSDLNPKKWKNEYGEQFGNDNGD